MAFQLSPGAQSVFFEKLFGEMNPVTVKVKQLIAAGAKFDVGLYTCKVEWKGKVYQVSLTKGSTSLMKGMVEVAVAEQNRALIVKWLMGLPGVMEPKVTPTPEVEKELVEPTVAVVLNGIAGNFIVLIKAIREVTGLGLLEAKHMVDTLSNGGQVTVLKEVGLQEAKDALAKLVAGGGMGYVTTDNDPAVEGTKPAATPVVEKIVEKVVEKVVVSEKAKPVSEVVSLRHAKAVGQKVKGTSPGSVYYCVALNERIRLAARIYKTGSISLRAEWDGTPTEELKKLESSGLQMKPAYASLHLNADGVPFGRVIGAFVMGTGIAWTDVVTNSADLVTE